MDVSPYLLDPRRLWAGEKPPSTPLVLIDCDVACEWPEALVLPPCPVVGIGDREHPLATRLDAMIETPVSVDTLVRQVLARPHAAAIVAELLRLLSDLTREQGLVAESFAYATLQAAQEHLDWRATREPGRADAPGSVRIARNNEVLSIVLDRANAGNAIDVIMRDALADALELAVVDRAISRVQIAGEGRCFSLGADLSEFGTTLDPASAHAIRRRTLPARLLAQLTDRLEVHVRGACVGAGLEMAAFARQITASADAWFQLPELAMGLLPGAGGCVSLTSRIGRQRTALMILSGRRISAPTALSWGLVDALVD